MQQQQQHERAAVFAIVPEMDPRDRDLPPLAPGAERGAFFPMLPLLAVQLPPARDIGTDPSAAGAVAQLLRLAARALSRVAPFALQSTGLVVALGPADAAHDGLQTHVPTADVVAGDPAALRAALLAGGVPELAEDLCAALVPLPVRRACCWALSARCFYLPTQAARAFRRAPKPRVRWGFVVQHVRLVALPPAADEAFGYGLLGPPVPVGRRAQLRVDPARIVEPTAVVVAGENPFAPLSVVAGDTSDSDDDSERDEANKERQEAEEDLAFRALKIPPLHPKQTRTAKRRERARRAAERKAAVLLERERKLRAAATEALGSGTVPEVGPWCREFDTVVEHMAATPRAVENLSHTRSMVAKAKRKSDADALAELVRNGFINDAQRKAVLAMLQEEMPVRRMSKHSNRSRRAITAIGNSRIELPQELMPEERLRDLRLLDMISDSEYEARLLEMQAEAAVLQQMHAIEDDWFMLSRHQAGPLADIMAQQHASSDLSCFAMMGPLAASLVAGSDPKFLIHRGGGGGGSGALVITGDDAAVNRRRRCCLDEGDASLPPPTLSELLAEGMAMMQEEELNELEKTLPSVASQYRALARIEHRMKKLQARRRIQDTLLVTKRP